MEAICSLRDILNRELLFPLFLLIFAVGLLLFVWGIVQFLMAQNGVAFGNKSAEDALKDGKKHMLWGIVGMFIIFAAFSLVTLIINIVGGSVTNCQAPTSGYFRGVN